MHPRCLLHILMVELSSLNRRRFGCCDIQCIENCFIPTTVQLSVARRAWQELLLLLLLQSYSPTLCLVMRPAFTLTLLKKNLSFSRSWTSSTLWVSASVRMDESLRKDTNPYRFLIDFKARDQTAKDAKLSSSGQSNSLHAR